MPRKPNDTSSTIEIAPGPRRPAVARPRHRAASASSWSCSTPPSSTSPCPSIQRDLHFSTSGLQWIVNAYTLTFAGFLLLGGRAADLFGRRRIFLVGLDRLHRVQPARRPGPERGLADRRPGPAGPGRRHPRPGHPDHPDRDLRRGSRPRLGAGGVERRVLGRRLGRRAARRHPDRPPQLALDPLRQRARRGRGAGRGPPRTSPSRGRTWCTGTSTWAVRSR